MKLIQVYKTGWLLFSSLFLFLFLHNCKEVKVQPPANLIVSNIEFTETYHSKYLDFPNNVPLKIDNPKFDVNNPDTWTGNVEKYVVHFRIYEVIFKIENTGGTAYDTEIDLYYTFANGKEEAETKYIGDIPQNQNYCNKAVLYCTNKELVECSAEVFWFNDY